LWYAVEFLVKLLCCCFNWNRAYKSVSFEQEAYKFETQDDWLENREPYYWLHYLFTLKVKIK